MNNIAYTFCELREREVINVADGRRLGRLNDMAFGISGCILGIIVPGEKNFFRNLAGTDNIFIPWECVLKIGTDVILADLNNNMNFSPCGNNCNRAIGCT
ncbi:YlmC/YmxH family sporulation protein [bacterium]|nr:YlmC/YmxH family sporulation protein [bacterium]